MHRLLCLPSSQQSPNSVTSPILRLEQLHTHKSSSGSETPRPLMQTPAEGLGQLSVGSSVDKTGGCPGTCSGDCPRSKGTPPAVGGLHLLLSSCYMQSWKHISKRHSSQVKTGSHNSSLLKYNFNFPKSV